MGCDIHAGIEWRRRDDWWVSTMSAEFLPRNYRFFGTLVDGHSRNYDENWRGVAPERGLPSETESDIAREVGAHRRHPDESYVGSGVCWADHTFSWLTPEEYAAAIAKYEAAFGPLDPEYHALGAYMNRLGADGRPVRLVIGFDN